MIERKRLDDMTDDDLDDLLREIEETRADAQRQSDMVDRLKGELESAKTTLVEDVYVIEQLREDLRNTLWGYETTLDDCDRYKAAWRSAKRRASYLFDVASDTLCSLAHTHETADDLTADEARFLTAKDLRTFLKETR